MSEQNVSRGTSNGPPSTYGERLRFVMWLAELELGVSSGKDFALAAGKRENQISRWLKEDPKPGWEITKGLAILAGVSPAWLDDPLTPGATEPELFGRWLDARRRWIAAHHTRKIPGIKPKDVPRMVAEAERSYRAKRTAKRKRSK